MGDRDDKKWTSTTDHREGTIHGKQSDYEGNSRNQAVKEFQKKGAMSTTTIIGLTLKMFIVNQADKKRPIIDCRPLNKHMNNTHFKMEDLTTAGTLIRNEDFLTKIDVKDAYLHVPMHPQARRYLQIKVGEKRLCMNSMPFGINIAPRVFTRIMKAALAPLR